MKKEKLNEILKKHKAQPVGNGYIDIIVSRDHYKKFVSELIDNDFVIESISWWEWCPEGQANKYGMGGPKSNFYKGWFSELGVDVDEISFFRDLNKEELIKEILNRIETKTISYPNETFTFKQDNWITPAIWLKVPDDWRNNYCA